MKKLILTIWVITSVSFTLQADSPLTSTNFFTVYEEYDVVNEALAAKGKLTNSLMIYLSDKAYPIDVKMAVVNALGWNFNGQKNYDKYINFVEMRLGLQRTDEAFMRKIDGDELLCLAYLKAMDNYFEVEEAKAISEAAVDHSIRTRNSYTFRLIDALIGAQMNMQGNWCDMYLGVKKVQDDESLNYDFPWEAEKVVFDYMDLYKNDCR